LLTLDLSDLSIVVGAVFEVEVVLLHVEHREALQDHSGVAEKDAVHRQAGSLDGVLVHF